MFPSFKVGDEAWTVACDGKVLLLRGSANMTKGGQRYPMDSLVPVQAISSLRLTIAEGGAASVHMRVWDGEEFSFGVVHGGAQDAVTGLIALHSAVRMVNASWPLSSARASAAKANVSPGYMRDQFMLGLQGIEEFWSTLSELPWEFANQWREAGLGALWPVAAAKADVDTHHTLVALFPDRLVYIDDARSAQEVPFGRLAEPKLYVAATVGSAHDWIGKQTALGIHLKGLDGLELRVALGDDQEVQPYFRFILFRWAESLVASDRSPVSALERASDALARGEMEPQAFAAVVDAVIAAESGVALSAAFPPLERSYLRPPERPATPRPGPPPTSALPSQVKRSGPSARQVAAGAAAGAALWSLFTE